MMDPIPPTKFYPGRFSDPARWQAFKPRNGDVVVVTPPKSGTTWLQSILALLISGDPDVIADVAFKSPWIDFGLRDVDEVMARLEAQTQRRHMKTHTPFDGIPVWPDVKYIAVYRHPIDVHFSMRKHAANMISEIGHKMFPEAYFDPDISKAFDLFLNSDQIEMACLSLIVDHYQSAMAMAERDNVLVLHYADMVRDLPKAFDQIVGLTGLSHPHPSLEQLINAARFDNMKANAHQFAPSAGQGTWKDDAAFFDSATSNKWEGVLTPSQMTAYDTRISELLNPQDRAWLEWGTTRGL